MRISVLLFFLALVFNLNGQNYKPDWESLDKRAVPVWFENSKYGIFIHCGVYSVPSWGPAGDSIGVYDKYAVVVNDRWGSETRRRHGGIFTTEYGLVGEKEGIDNSIYHPWEECRGVGTSFGFNRTEGLNDYSSAEDLIELLVSTVSAGGNLLLDIGPVTDGTIPIIMQQRLLEIGTWLKTNGDIFVICLAWPNENIILNGLKSDASTKVRMFGTDKPVALKQNGNKLIITPPAMTLADNQLAYVFKISNILK